MSCNGIRAHFGVYVKVIKYLRRKDNIVLHKEKNSTSILNIYHNVYIYILQFKVSGPILVYNIRHSSIGFREQIHVLYSSVLCYNKKIFSLGDLEKLEINLF